MLKIRTVILSVALVVVLMLTAQLVAARTEVASHPSNASAGVSENQAPISRPNDVGNTTSYRSSLGECFDVPLREAAECRDPGQTIIHSDHSAIDECIDVSISEVAGCREASQGSAQ